MKFIIFTIYLFSWICCVQCFLAKRSTETEIVTPTFVNESIFPSQFTTAFNGFGQDFEFDFVKDNNEDYGSLYVINSDTDKAEEYDGSYKDIASYKDREGRASATLVKNGVENTPKLVVNFVHNESSYILVPNMAKYLKRKRSLNSNQSNYIIHKSDIIDSRKENETSINVTSLNETKASQNRTNKLQLTYEVLVVVDCSSTKHIAKMLNLTFTRENMPIIQMYAYVMYGRMMNDVRKGFNVSYRNVTDYSVYLFTKAILIQTSAEECQWSDSKDYKVPGFSSTNGIEAVNIGKALMALKQYVYNLSLPFTFDGAIGLLHKYLCINATYCPVGVSIGSSVCLYATSIVRIFDYNLGVLGIVHEIVHSLGAPHDNITNNPECTGYIMDVNHLYTNQYTDRIRYLSSCSISKIRNSTFDSKGRILPYRKCLLNKVDKKQTVNDFFDKYLLDPNEQCKFVFGVNSSFCGHKFASICTSGIFCVNGAARCQNTTVANGISCDIGKVCKNQKCVSSPYGSLSECIYSDGTIGEGEELGWLKLPAKRVTCKEAVYVIQNASIDPVAFCIDSNYQKGFAKTCCNLCKKLKLQKCHDTSVFCKKSYCNDTKWIPLCQYTCKLCKREPVYCSNHTCANNAICVNRTDKNPTDMIGFRCRCQLQNTGEFCDKRENPCLNNPCKNGTCIYRYNTPYCRCFPGFKGLYCEEQL